MNNSLLGLLGLMAVLVPFGTSMPAMGIADNEYYPDQHMRYGDDRYGSNQDRTYENNDYKQKDKDSSNSVSITKLNCINVNNNINGDVIGNVNVGNSANGATADNGNNEALNSNGYGSNDRNNDGYQNSNGFSCISTNNNNNSIVTGGGNATNGNGTNGNVTLTCEECFVSILNETQIADLELFFAGAGIIINIDPFSTITINNFTTFCQFLANAELDFFPPPFGFDLLTNYVRQLLDPIDANEVTIDELVVCIAKDLGLAVPDNGVGSLATAGLSNSPSITGSGLSNLPTAPSLGLP
jgi:hypothetical protein